VTVQAQPQAHYRNFGLAPRRILGGVVLGTSLSIPAFAIEHPSADAVPAVVLRLAPNLRSLARGLPSPLHSDSVRTQALTSRHAAAVLPEPFGLHWADAISVAQVGDKPPAAAAGADAPGANDSAADADADEEPAVVVEVSESPPPPASAAGSPEPGPSENAPREKHYGLAPIRWGGELGYSRRKQRPEDGAKVTTNIYELSLQAASYILQPWIAQINGRISLALVGSETEADDGGKRSTDSTAISGSLGASIFPLSRFPLLLTFSVADSRSESTFLTNTRRSYRFSAVQQYRPVRGRWSASGSYDWDRVDTENGETDTIHRLGGNYRWSDDKQQVNLQGTFSQNERADSFSSQSFVATGNHSIRPRTDFSVNSTATLLYDKRGAVDAASSELRSFQVFSAANWVPLESPWSATASGRYSHTDSGSGSTGSDSVALNTSARYRFSRNLNSSVGLSAASTRSGGSQRTVSVQTASLSYSGDPLKLGKFSYNWGTGGGISNTISDQNSGRSFSTNASHSLNRVWLPSPPTSIGATASQTVSYNRSTGFDNLSTTSVSNSASLTLRANPSNSSTGTFGLTYSDTRSLGDRQAHFRMLDAQLSGYWDVTRRSQLSGNLSYQKSWRDETLEPLPQEEDPFATGEDRRDQDTSLNGTLTYYHDRPFSVHGLRYSLRYLASTSNSQNDREFGVIGAAPADEQTTQQLEQNLDYRVGRLNTRLQFTVAEVDGRKNAVLYFRVSRSFGGF